MVLDKLFFKLDEIKEKYVFDSDKSYKIIISPDILPESPLGLAIYKYRPGQTGLAHKHDKEVEIYFVLKGSGKVRIENEVFPLEPGIVVYIPPKKEHQTKSCADDSLEFISIFVPSIKL
jgi:mannose-6-phosphate isomerase-like protein (cupin superfamily)